MVDILEFIDSKEIRECNRNRIFTPIEQAVLIYASEKKTVEEFQQGKVGRLTGTNTCFAKCVEIWWI